MDDWFSWNGRKCTRYGIHVSEQPPITIPLERSKQVTVPGRPGSLTLLEGDDVYDDLMLTVTCFVQDSSRIPEIAGWLKGSGTVTFANRQGGHYNARVANQIAFEKILRGNPHRSFAVNFRCSPPFWYADDAEDITLTTSTTTVNNPGNVYSEPLIKVYGSGDITLMIGQQLVELSSVNNYLFLDCALKECYRGSALRNEKMTGDFPVLVPGDNAISWTGSVTRIVIEPRWRYL